MRKKRFLAAILLGVVFCFVSGAGYGKIDKRLFEVKALFLDFVLQEARIDHIMCNPDIFLGVSFC